MADAESDDGPSSRALLARLSRPWVLGIVAFGWACGLTVVFAYRFRSRIVPGNLQVRDFAHPVGALNHLVANSDAQTFVGIARDPLLRRPELWVDGPPLVAFRYSRPLLGYLVWAASFGQRHWAPYALALLSCVACGATIVLAAKLVDVGRAGWLVALLLVTPAYPATIDVVTADFLALALSLGGLLAWRSSRWWRAGALFALAGLAHEHYLLIPLVLLTWELIRGARRPIRLAPLVLAPLPYCAWIILVQVRVQAWPWESARDNLGAPLRGLSDGIATWSPLEVAGAFGLLAVLVTALLAGERGLLLTIGVAYAALSVLFGQVIWNDWAGFSRVLLPLVVFCWLAIVARLGAPSVRTTLCSQAQRLEDAPSTSPGNPTMEPQVRGSPGVSQVAPARGRGSPG